MKDLKFSTLTSVIIIILFVVGGYFFVKYISPGKKVEPTSLEVENKPFVLVDKSLVLEKKYSEPDKYTTFDVTYPQFKNVPDEFNKNIEYLMMSAIATHKEDSEANWKARYDTRTEGDGIIEFPKQADKFSFMASWAGVQVNDDFVSITITISAFSGGAHGYESKSSFNYDVAEKREILLSELFPNDSNYLKTISDYSRKDLEAQFRKNLNLKTKEEESNFKDSILSMMMLGTEPDEENFSVFTFTPDSVRIYFGQYQVAPYSMGTFMVNIPRK